MSGFPNRVGFQRRAAAREADRREHGLQGRLSPVGGPASDRRLDRADAPAVYCPGFLGLHSRAQSRRGYLSDRFLH